MLIERIGAIHTASKGTYGAPRIHAELKANGIHIGKKRVARLMRRADLAGVSRRRFVTTTVRDGARQAPDLVERDFTAERPNMLWVADITYIPTFKIVVLQGLYNLSDEQTEFLIRDRLPFMRFLDLGLEDAVPDATTIWLFREALVAAGLIDTLFDRFGQHLQAKGYVARGGQIVDATIVSAPKQRNSKDENEAIKAVARRRGSGRRNLPRTPRKTRMRAGPRSTARASMATRTTSAWTSCTRSSTSGAATDASAHDSQKLDEILDASNTGSQVWADSAYHSAEIEARLAAKGLKSRIHRRAARNRPLSPTQATTTSSRVRARVEHVFGHQENSMGRKIVRTIGMARARFKIGMMNLGYNMRRLVQLERAAAAPA